MSHDFHSDVSLPNTKPSSPHTPHTVIGGALPGPPLPVHPVRPAPALALVEDDQVPGFGAADVHIRCKVRSARRAEVLPVGRARAARSRASRAPGTGRRPGSPGREAARSSGLLALPGRQC